MLRSPHTFSIPKNLYLLRNLQYHIFSCLQNNFMYEYFFYAISFSHNTKSFYFNKWSNAPFWNSLQCRCVEFSIKISTIWNRTSKNNLKRNGNCKISELLSFNSQGERKGFYEQQNVDGNYLVDFTAAITRLTGWLIDWLTDWLISSLTKWLIRLAVTEWLSECLVEWMNEWMK